MNFDFKQRGGELVNWFRSFPLIVQLGAVVAVLLVVLWLAGGMQSAWSHFNDWRFDRRAAAAEAERDQVRAERDAALRRAEAAEAQAAVFEEQAAALKKVAEDKGATAREKTAAAEEIEHATDAAIERAGANPATARDEYREALRRLGYLPR